MSASPLRSIISDSIGNLATIAATGSPVLLSANGLAADASPLPVGPTSSRPA